MIDKLGVIPAAGKANRFSGMNKELLPHSQSETLLSHLVNNMRDFDVVQVISNPEKIHIHANHLKQINNVVFSLQHQGMDIWGAIIESFKLGARHNVFAMPDTLFPSEIIGEMFDDHFCIGWFETEKPDRYGVLTENGIVNKMPAPAGKYSAWGVLSWSNAVVDYWKDNIEIIQDYTQAFNMAIEHFGFTLHKMDYYYDFASLKDYKAYMAGAYVV